MNAFKGLLLDIETKTLQSFINANAVHIALKIYESLKKLRGIRKMLRLRSKQTSGGAKSGECAGYVMNYFNYLIG